MKNDFYQIDFFSSRFAFFKKSFFIFLILIFCITNFFSQENSDASQVVLPIEVFVGDKVEVRYTFRSSVDFFSNADQLKKKDNDHFILKNPFENLSQKFVVVESEIYRTDLEYTIRFEIIPWTVGQINFPSFNLGEVLTNQKNLNFYVSLFPIEVKSIVEKTGKNQMMPPVPPMIVPGTTYIIFFLILLLLIFLILFFRILLKFNSIKRKWKMYLQKRAFKKNAEETIRKLKKLSKTNLSDIEFCSKLQSYLRLYLDFRFDYNFSATSSSSIRAAFEKICAGDIPDEIAYAVENIISVFLRTDYIRFAHDSIDSKLEPLALHQAILVEQERKSLPELIIKSIETFESDKDSSSEEKEK